MAKLTLNDIGRVTSSAATLNANNQAIETAMEKTLSRDGTAPNEMNALLDMNGYTIINLPVPTTDTEPLRKGDISDTGLLADFIGPIGPQGVQGIQGIQGVQGIQGIQGIQGVQGETGEGVLAGGTTGQLLAKASNADYDTVWSTSAPLTDGDKGDITVSTGGTVFTIDAGVVTLAKQADVVTSTIMGRVTAGTGVQEALTPTQARSILQTPTVVLGTPVTTTSGIDVDFTSIPSGVTQIVIMFSAVSTNGTADLLVQIGDSGGIELSGYTSNAGWILNAGASTVTAYTTGFGVAPNGSAVNTQSGIMTLTLIDASTFTWVASGTSIVGNVMALNAGTKSLSSELTTIRFATGNGSDTFDSGKVNIRYEYI